MKSKKLVVFSFVFIYALFLYCDITRYSKINFLSIYIKFAGIVLCFLLSILIGRDSHDSVDIKLLIGALFFTVAADYFLLFGKNLKLGVLFFCIVQSIYTIRHSRKTVLTRFYYMVVSVILIIAIFLASFIHIYKADQILKAILFLYGGLLLISTFSAIRTTWFDGYPKNASTKIAAGLVLFMLCDINVALFNTSNSFSNISGFLIWIFYFPSQVLLALSGLNSNVDKIIT